MTERRLPNTRPTPRLERGDEPPRPTCATAYQKWATRRDQTGDQSPWMYDVLIDATAGPEYQWASREARKLCLTCPIRPACWTENRGEPWLDAVLDIRYPPMLRPSCGTPAGAKAHYQARETPCDDCRKAEAARTRARKHAKKQAEEAAKRAEEAAQRAAEAAERRLPGIPDDIRALHATHVRYKKAGADIPPSVIDGERTYQALRHQTRRARKTEAA